MTGFEWSPIADGFGAQVTGLDIAKPISEPDAAALRALWIDRALLLFRGMPISDDAQVALTEVFGPAMAHKASETKLEGRQEIIRIGYSPQEPDKTMVYDVGGVLLANWQPWHIDTIYTPVIEHGGALRAIEVPESGADTGFIDRAQLYERMPEDLRRRIEGRRVIYKLNPRFGDNPFNPRHRARMINMPEHTRRMEQRAATELPPVSHPIVMRHPESGRTVLNVGTLHIVGIEGMPKAEGDALLREVIAFALEAGERYYHKWQHDDLVVWDNWRLLHSAEGTPVASARMLFRTGIGGEYGEGRLARPEATAA